MGVPSGPIYPHSMFLGNVEATTDSGKTFPVFYNNSGMDIVITEAQIACTKGVDAASYMTANLCDQDANVISTLAYTVVSATATVITAMGTCSATHGVIPDAEYVYLQFAQTNDGDSLDDCAFFMQFKYQNPED